MGQVERIKLFFTFQQGYLVLIEVVGILLLLNYLLINASTHFICKCLLFMLIYWTLNSIIIWIIIYYIRLLKLSTEK